MHSTTRLRIAAALALAMALVMAFAFGYGAAWSVLSSPRAQPVQGARPVAADDPLIRDYAGLGEALE